ncbi:MAG: cupin domain-containing protein [Acidobacteria bacterium]|nr:cupin domain-containing protein [Acidobacteriota bacterium]
MSLAVMRRIVTGHNEQGKAVIVSDAPPAMIIDFKAIPGTVFYEIWNTNESPVAINNAPDPTLRPVQLHPTPQGSIIRFVDIPPDSVQENISGADIAAGFAHIGAASAATHNDDSPHKLMHRTETIDYGILISGELWLIVDEGETKLTVGDVVIQRGTNHAWANRSNEVARMVFILLDGKFAEGIA